MQIQQHKQGRQLNLQSMDQIYNHSKLIKHFQYKTESQRQLQNILNQQLTFQPESITQAKIIQLAITEKHPRQSMKKDNKKQYNQPNLHIQNNHDQIQPKFDVLRNGVQQSKQLNNQNVNSKGQHFIQYSQNSQANLLKKQFDDLLHHNKEIIFDVKSKNSKIPVNHGCKKQKTFYKKEFQSYHNNIKPFNQFVSAKLKHNYFISNSFKLQNSQQADDSFHFLTLSDNQIIYNKTTSNDKNQEIVNVQFLPNLLRRIRLNISNFANSEVIGRSILVDVNSWKELQIIKPQLVLEKMSPNANTNQFNTNQKHQQKIQQFRNNHSLLNCAEYQKQQVQNFVEYSKNQLIKLQFPQKKTIGIQKIMLTKQPQISNTLFQHQANNFEQGHFEGIDLDLQSKITKKEVQVDQLPKNPKYESLIINSYHTCQGVHKHQNKQLSFNPFMNKTIQRIQEILNPPQVGETQNCHNCEKNKAVIYSYWEKARHLQQQEEQLRQQNKLLKQRCEYLDMVYKSSQKKLIQSQKQIKEILNLLQHKRAWREAEIQYFNGQVVKRQTDNTKANNQIIKLMNDVYTFMDSAKENMVLLLTEQHKQDVRKFIIQKQHLLKQLEASKQSNVLNKEQFQKMVKSIMISCKKHKDRVQQQESQISQLKLQIDQQNIISKENQDYILFLQKKAHTLQEQFLKSEQSKIEKYLQIKTQRKLLFQRIDLLQEKLHGKL